MRLAAALLPFALLAACATPREQCIDDVTRDARVQAALIEEIRGNLARGYALREEQEVRTFPRTCTGKDDDGDTFSFSCNRTTTFTRTVPVAIDLNAEEAKLASLEERYAQTQAASNQAVAQCIAVHPE